MDRGFPGVALWKAYTQAGAHLLIRARSSVARRPVTVLDDGTYLARMNLAGQKGAHPGGVLVRVIEYRVDGGEVVRLLTDLMDPVAFPAGELASLYHQRWESETANAQLKTFLRGPQDLAVAVPGHGRAGDLGLPPDPLRDQRPGLHRRDQRRDRPGQGEVQENDPRRPPPGRRPGFFPLTSASASWTRSPQTSPAART